MSIPTPPRLRPHWRPGRPLGPGERDRGSVSVFFVVVALALLIAVGLVVDGGGKIRALQRADAAAAEAARAGGQAITAAPVRGEQPQLAAAVARSAAAAHLAAAGVAGTATVTGGTRLQVRTSTTYTPVFLSVIGVGAMTTTGYAEARLVRGLDGEQ